MSRNDMRVILSIFFLVSVNLFRPRATEEATEETRNMLKEYGATWAVTESELADSSSLVARELRDAGSAKLALNCVGGKNALVLMKNLANGGVLVSYGAMSRSPMPIPVGPLIFKDISLRGFWVSGWIKRVGVAEREPMLHRLSDWFSTGAMKPSPFLSVPFSDWKIAIEHNTFGDATPTAISKKAILIME